MTIIHIASENPIKVNAVKEVVAQYKVFDSPLFKAMAVNSEISPQPIGLAETVQGAKNRANNAFSGADIAFGIESGIFALPHSIDEYVDITACSIFDGRQHYIGFSQAFLLPRCATDLIHQQGIELSQAMVRSRVTDQNDIGKQEGAIGLFSKGRMTRQSYTMQAVLTALIPFENRQVYYAN